MNLKSLTVLGHHFIGCGELRRETDSKIENLSHRLRREAQVVAPIIGFSSDSDAMRTAMCLGKKFGVGAQFWSQLDEPHQKAVELEVLLTEVGRWVKPEHKHVVLVVEPLSVVQVASFCSDRLGVNFNQTLPPIKEGTAISLVPSVGKVWSFSVPNKTNLSLATT